MFGYIRPVEAELKVKEYELYKAVYCGLCDSLGVTSSCKSRLTLSYDFVFLALVRMVLAGEVGKIERHRCIAHPTKKRSHLVDSNQLDYCARVSSILTYHKLLDDLSDESGAKRFAVKSLLPAARSIRKHALSDKTEGCELGALDSFISERLSELSAIEKDRIYSVDRAAEPFGELMAEVTAHGLDSIPSRIGAEIGRHIGRFVYIADAADDLVSDLESGAYNPFRIDGASNEEILSAFRKNIDRLKISLTLELDGASRALELLDDSSVLDKTAPEFLSIVKNIVYLGLPGVIKRVTGKCELAETSPTNRD